MRATVLLVALPLVLAGCLGPSATVEPAAADAAGADAAGALPEVAVLEFAGHVVHSAVDGPSHMRPTEDVLWPVQKEGFLLDVAEVPEAMEVALEWSGGGQFMIMLHSHKAEGTNEYVEHVTEMSADAPHCLRVPAADLTAGVWQVMVHNRGAVNADFTIKVLTAGGAASIVEDDRHGHWLQDGSFSVDEHDIEPCALYAPPAA